MQDGSDSVSRYHLALTDEGEDMVLESNEFCITRLAFDWKERRLVCFHQVPPEMATDRQFMVSVGERCCLAWHLHHPCLFALTDFGDREGQFFWTTEMTEGEPIDDWLARVQRLPMTVAVDLSLQLCRVLRCLGDYPRLLANMDTEDLFIYYTPGQSLRVRAGRMGLNHTEVPLTESQIGKRWVPKAARLVWKLFTISLSGPEADALPEPESGEFLNRFCEFVQKLTSGRVRHTPDDLFHLEKEVTRYGYEFLNSFQTCLQSQSPTESQRLRPRTFLRRHLLTEQFLTGWKDHHYIFRPGLESPVCNYALPATISGNRDRRVLFQIFPSDNMKGSGGMGSVYQKMGHPYLKDHPSFVHSLFLIQEGAYMAVAEDPLHGFNLAHLIERRGFLLVEEVIELMRQIHWVMSQTDQVGVETHPIRPWEVYFDFDEDCEDQALAFLLSGSRLNDWPGFEIRLRLGITTTDFVRPVCCVWTEINDGLAELSGCWDSALLPFVSLAAWMLDYRTQWTRLITGPSEAAPLPVRCSIFSDLAVNALRHSAGNDHDDRATFIRLMESWKDSLSFDSDPQKEEAPEIEMEVTDSRDSWGNRAIETDPISQSH